LDSVKVCNHQPLIQVQQFINIRFAFTLSNNFLCMVTHLHFSIEYSVRFSETKANYIVECITDRKANVVAWSLSSHNFPAGKAGELFKSSEEAS